MAARLSPEQKVGSTHLCAVISLARQKTSKTVVAVIMEWVRNAMKPIPAVPDLGIH